MPLPFQPGDIMFHKLLVATTMLLGASQAFAVFQCKSADGITAFQDTPCVQADAKSPTPTPTAQPPASARAVQKTEGLTDAMVREYYKQQTQAMVNVDPQRLCDAMDESFTGTVKATINGSARDLKIKSKQEGCRSNWAMSSALGQMGLKPAYTLDIVGISISSDRKQAMVRSKYTFEVKAPNLSSKGYSTDTLVLKNGSVYMTQVQGEASYY